MREDALSAASRVGRPRGPRTHGGTIIPETVDAMWGTDMTAAATTEHGQVAFGRLARPHRGHDPPSLVAVDHRSAERTGVLEPPRVPRR